MLVCFSLAPHYRSSTTSPRKLQRQASFYQRGTLSKQASVCSQEAISENAEGEAVAAAAAESQGTTRLIGGLINSRFPFPPTPASPHLALCVPFAPFQFPTLYRLPAPHAYINHFRIW